MMIQAGCQQSIAPSFLAQMACAALIAAAAGWTPALAQTGHQMPAERPAAVAPAPPPLPGLAPPPKREGFFDALGRWWDQSQSEFKSNLNKMKGQIDSFNERTAKATRDAVEATRDATDALVKLPSTRIVEGRERCAIAPNGSPDCQGAAETICRSKGFKSGASANIESARKCSARALLSRSDEDCTTETIVTRAACQ